MMAVCPCPRVGVVGEVRVKGDGVDSFKDSSHIFSSSFFLSFSRFWG